MKAIEVESNLIEVFEELKKNEHVYLIDILFKTNHLLYILYSFKQKQVLVYKMNIGAERIDSLCELWKNAEIIESRLQKFNNVRFSINYRPHYKRLFCEEPYLSPNTEVSEGLYTTLIKNFDANKMSFKKICLILKEIESNVSDKDQAVRMIFLEIERIFENLEKIKKFFEYFDDISMLKECDNAIDLISQVRQQLDYSSAIDLSNNKDKLEVSLIGPLCLKILDSLEVVLKKLAYWDKQKVLHDFLSIPLYKKEDILSYSITGQIAQVGGVNIDWRKLFNLYLYNQIESINPISNLSTLKSFYSLLLQDLEASIKVIEQLISNFPVSRNTDQVTSTIENETRQIISVNDNSWGFDGCLFTIENGELIDYELFGIEKYHAQLSKTFKACQPQEYSFIYDQLIF